jgi:hypothetical protein
MFDAATVIISNHTWDLYGDGRMEAAWPCEMLVSYHPTKWHHNPEGHDMVSLGWFQWKRELLELCILHLCHTWSSSIASWRCLIEKLPFIALFFLSEGYVWFVINILSQLPFVINDLGCLYFSGKCLWSCLAEESCLLVNSGTACHGVLL